MNMKIRVKEWSEHGGRWRARNFMFESDLFIIFNKNNMLLLFIQPTHWLLLLLFWKWFYPLRSSELCARVPSKRTLYECKNVNVCFVWSMLKSRQLFCMHTTYDLYIKNLNTRRLQNQRRRDGQRDRDGVWSCFLLPLTRVCTNTNAINKSHLLKN